MHKQIIRIAIALAALGTACVNKSGTTSPVSPSLAIPTSTRGANGSASISGTVLTVSTGAAFQPAGSSLTVAIVGTSMSATIDGAGHFTLQNVPSGDLKLAFSGAGHNARIEIDDVADFEQIHIVVNLNGTNADVDENERATPDSRATVEGQIVSITCGATSSTMVVGQRRQTTVIVPAGTPIRDDDRSLTCSQLMNGPRVRVKGLKIGAAITATKVDVKDIPEPPDDYQVKVKGTVSAITSRSCATNTVVFTVLSSGPPTEVTTNASTNFEETTCATLAVNDRVEVKGTPMVGGIFASKVEGKDRDDDTDDNEELTGTLGPWNAMACPAVSSNVSGTAFSTTAATDFEDTTCARLTQGDRVEVKGRRQPDGSVVATKVDKKR